MILSGCFPVTIGSWKTEQHKTVSSWNPRNSKVSACNSRIFSKVAFPTVSCSWTQHQELKYPNSRARSPHHLGALSLPLTSPLRGQKRRFATAKAFLPDFLKFRARYPAMQEKPKFWWRVLACLPYLIPLHSPYMHAGTAYHLHPFLETLYFRCQPFLNSIGRIRWLYMVYIFGAYLGIVRMQMWPHFLRYHVTLALLLEVSLQVTAVVTRWVPKALLWGKIGMHFWCMVAFSSLFTVLECIRCALCGMYADVPYLSDAAYVQIPVVPERPKNL